MGCKLGVRGHLDRAEVVCSECYGALRRERLHVNPEADRREARRRLERIATWRDGLVL